jgi:hypothetical protein
MIADGECVPLRDGAGALSWPVSVLAGFGGGWGFARFLAVLAAVVVLSFLNGRGLERSSGGLPGFHRSPTAASAAHSASVSRVLTPQAAPASPRGHC